MSTAGLDAVRPARRPAAARTARGAGRSISSSSRSSCCGGLDVLAGDDRRRPSSTIRSATWPICRIVGAELGGHGGLRVAQPGDLGDVPGQVAHPLEVGAHPQRGDDRSAGRWRPAAGGPAGRTTAVVELVARRVDLRRRRRSPSRRGGRRRRAGPSSRGSSPTRPAWVISTSVVGDAVELLVVGVAHHGMSSGRVGAAAAGRGSRTAPCTAG